MEKKTICLILILVHLPLPVLGQNNHFFTLSNVKARPLAMGGAFTSIEDDLAAINFNPAAYLLNKKNDSRPVTIFLNPVSPFIAAFQNKDLYTGSGSKFDDILMSLSLLFKSMSVTLKSFELGVLLGEESLNLPPNFIDGKLFRVTGFRQNHSHAIIGRLKLADKVSLGGTANFLFGSHPEHPFERFNEIAISYGILLKPEKGLNIGVSFINLPDTLQQYRLPLERIVDESVNIGLSYRLFNGTLLSLDIRNLGEETQNVVREFHFGMEQVLFSQLALRLGYFKKVKGGHVFSGGFGLLNGSRIFKNKYDLKHNNFYLNYAFVYEKSSGIKHWWHLLTFIISI